MHAYNGVLTVLGLAWFLCFVFCVSVQVKLTVQLLCVCVHSAWKGRPRNELYSVGWDVKPYSLTHSLYDSSWFVFNAGRMGNTKQALQLITNELGDVNQAIEFCKEHNERELWEDLITYSIDKPSQ